MRTFAELRLLPLVVRIRCCFARELVEYDATHFIPPLQLVFAIHPLFPCSLSPSQRSKSIKIEYAGVFVDPEVTVQRSPDTCVAKAL